MPRKMYPKATPLRMAWALICIPFFLLFWLVFLPALWLLQGIAGAYRGITRRKQKSYRYPQRSQWS